MYYESNYLEHHGIKGQRWGVRRYQNYDGSYTKAGLTRYQKAKAELDKATISGTHKQRRVAKRKEKQAWNELRQDYKADKGKALYAAGERSQTIRKSNNTTRQALRIITPTLAAAGLTVALNVPMAAPAAIGGAMLGGEVWNTIKVKQGNIKISQLNAYYGKNFMEKGAGLAEYEGRKAVRER